MSRPDISYHLVFCFLNLRELTLIAQCSQEFRRIVTRESFVRMYSSQEMVTIYFLNMFSLLIESSFKSKIESIRFINQIPLILIQYINQFPNLKSMKLEYKNVYDKDEEKIQSLDEIPSQSLESLNVNFSNTHDIDYFLKSFSLFPNLTELDMTIYYHDYSNLHEFNLSNMIQLKKLRSLKMYFSYKYPSREDMIHVIRLLPELEVLQVNVLFNEGTFFGSTVGLRNLRCLCAQPGAPSCLKTIGSFSNFIPERQQTECAQLLEQLPALEEINFGNRTNFAFPISFSRWIKHLVIYDTSFLDAEVTYLAHLNKLESIELCFCDFNHVRLEQMINTHGSRLKILKIINSHSGRIDLSFSTISQCSQLTILELENFSGLFAFEFHLLNKCKKLQQIRLEFCDLKSGEYLDSYSQQALKLPSKVFPELIACHIFH